MEDEASCLTHNITSFVCFTLINNNRGSPDDVLSMLLSNTMNDDNNDRESFSLRLRNSNKEERFSSPNVGIDTEFSKGSPLPITSDGGSRAGSSTTNQARHSTTSSLLKRLESSGDVVNGYLADGVSDPDTEWASPNAPKRRKGGRDPSGASPVRPISRTATQNRIGKAQMSGSDNRLYSAFTNSQDNLGDSGGSLQIHPPSGSSPVPTRSPNIQSARSGQSPLASTPVPHESRESSVYERRHDGGYSTVAGGTASHGIFKQPETHPITEDQLTNEVRGIYAGLVMVERKCIEIVKQQLAQDTELSREQWRALIALHRTLLQEHHDFFMASQHPTATTVLRKSPEKYNVPARMWRYGIQAFLELLHRRLPDSLEHMLTFIYLAYSMLTLLLETVPEFEDTWIECLGDLSRYGVVIEERGLLDHDIWAGIARYWYNKAVDQNPDVGRIQHHLGVLARPDLVQQLFYYTKSLVSVRPFPRTKVSILRFFSPLLQGPRVISYPHVTTAFVSAHGYLFTQNPAVFFVKSADEFLTSLHKYVPRLGVSFRMQGIHLSSTNFAAMLEYGETDALLSAEFHQLAAQPPRPIDDVYASAADQWGAVTDPNTIVTEFLALGAQKNPSQLVYGSCLSFETLSILLDHLGNMNMFPAIHISLAFLWCLSFTTSGMKCAEAVVPWTRIVAFLNTIIQHNFLLKMVEGWLDNLAEMEFNVIEGIDFPRSDETKWLPEDFFIRGQVWSHAYYPPSFFDNCPSEEEGRNVERESLSVSRIYRCLWLGVRLAKFNRWWTYDPTSRRFSVTPFAQELEQALERQTSSEFDKMAETKEQNALYLIRRRFELPGASEGVPGS
ncbi:hypothetical protein BDV25DRAFT_153919 [Aspergillus avenaceus]|uniref:Uncharacterized protein n=1 Tax=Aspergillus avenaceus TaxID=36643 RepID=A0A5N6TWV4_ASPAV|nr:hypothetical protein BDV25DRAFT_153919 [Aspergillus avenaceus]